MGHGILSEEFGQGTFVAAQEIHIKADTVFLRNYLVVFISQESFDFGQVPQHLSFIFHIVNKRFKICPGRLGVGICTGQKQRIQLTLGSGDRNDFNNILFIGIFPHGRIAAHAVMVADGAAHNITIQQGRNKLWL